MPEKKMEGTNGPDPLLACTRVPHRKLWLRTFVSGTYGIRGVRVKQFSCTCNLVEHRAWLSLDSLYVDHV
jgi:hypothetical protein